jgi:hypothetical protein
MKRYLWANQVLLKNFGEHADQVTGRLKEASLAAAKRPTAQLAECYRQPATAAMCGA